MELTAEERAEIALVDQSDEEVMAEAGTYDLWGERGYTTWERRFARPTLDFNGMWGGWQGDGVKTVTPCQAHLKITCRLVPNQDPAVVIDRIRAHVAAHPPAGARVAVVQNESGARAYVIPRDDPFLRTAASVLTDVYGTPPLVVRSGGSVPITETFKTILGLDTVTIGFGLPGSKIHAPNEWFRMEDLARARSTYARYLEAAAGMG